MKSSIFSIIIIVMILASNQCMSQDAPLFTESDTTLANDFFNRAKELYKKAQYDSSIFYYEKAGVIYQKSGERFDTTTLWEKYVKCLNNIGSNLRKLGKYDNAMEISNKALKIALDKFGTKHPEIASIYNNIGVVNKKRGNYDKALEYYNKALAIRFELLEKNHPEIADSYSNIGVVYRIKGDFDNAIKYQKKSLAIREKLWGQNHLDVAGNNNNIGAVYWQKGNYDKALEYFKKSLAIRIELLGENHTVVSGSYNNIGVICKDKGDYSNALKYFNKSLTIRLGLLGGNHPYVATSYNNIGIVYYHKNDFDKTLEFYTKSLKIREKVFGENHPDVAGSYNNIGRVYSQKANYDKALKCFQKALVIHLALLNENHPTIAIIYNNIGIVYKRKGDYDKALEYYSKSLAIAMESYGKDHPDVLYCYSNIGTIYNKKGDFDKALEYYSKSLAIGLKIYGEKHTNIVSIYKNIGTIYRRKNDYDKALEYYIKALSIGRELFGENHLLIAASYNNIGIINKDRGQYDQACEYYKRSLLIRLEKLGKNHPVIAETYINFGKLFCKQNDLEKALSYFQKSIIVLIPDFEDTNIYVNPSLEKILAENHLLISLEQKAKALRKFYSIESHDLKDLKMSLATYHLASQLIDKMRSGYKAEGSKLFLGENASKIYDKAIQTALKLYEVSQQDEYQKDAFLLAEKGKSAVLLASLQDCRARHLAGIPDSVIEREKELKIDLAFYDTQIQKESQKNDDLDSLKLRDFENRYFALNTQYRKLIEEIETTYPKYYDLKYQTQTASIPELQQTLDEKTSLVEYFLGDSLLFIFTISKNEFDVISLPTDSTLLQLAESMNSTIKKVKMKKYLNAGYRMYCQLVKPIEDKIADKDKLIIIPHGMLYKIPFDALINTNPTENIDPDFTRLDYLIRRFEISYHYSATLYLNTLQAGGKALAGRSQPAKEFLGFAPVFSDEKNNGYILAGNLPTVNIAYAGGDVRAVSLDGKRFNELIHSEYEVQKIVKLYEKNNKNAIGYFHTDASEKNFKTTVGDYQYVHVATHGFINEDKPQLSGVIFSQPTDSTDTEDGILYAGETYNLNLKADLVVLSSCESGIGKLVRGEGLMALTRGFLYSGASNIIVSLWKVPDKETGELMVEFYKNHLSGKSYSGSLRLAKLKMIGNAEAAFPKAWSSFVLIGR